MKARIIFSILILAALMGAQAQASFKTSTQVNVYAAAGAAGYEVSESRPNGPEIRTGFMGRYGTLAIHGAGSYNSYRAGDVTRRFYSFEGGLGAYVLKELSFTAGFAYYGYSDGSDGAYGLVIRPALELAHITPNLSVIVVGGMSFTDDFMAYSGLIGLSYQVK